MSYEFQELAVTEYRNAQKASVTVEIYRHSTPTQAFGIYSPATILAQQFELAEIPAWSPRYNIASTQEVLAVLKTSDCAKR